MLEKNSLPSISLNLLERCFPRTCQALSETERASLAREWAASGKSLELRDLPELLERKKWASSRGFIPDLSRLELELRLAALAPELPAAGFERVPTAVEPEWYSARFRFDPGHRLIESDWPLVEAYADPARPHELRSSVILIYREDAKASFRELSANEAALLRALGLGVPLGKVLDRPMGPDFDARTFHGWMATGLLREIVWSAELS